MRASVVLIVFAAAAAPALADTPVKLSKAQHAQIERAVRDKLKDPEAARFDRAQAMQRADGRVYVCGYVNAKNSYGGYGGRTPYIGYIVPGGFHVIMVSSRGSDQQAVLETCAARGMNLADANGNPVR